MLAIYYGNGWNARSLPFMSTHLLNANGTAYPVESVFPGGVLDENQLAQYGTPRLTGTFAWSLFCANAAVGIILYRVIRRPTNLSDWCTYYSLFPFLGQRYSAGIQERKGRPIRR